MGKTAGRYQTGVAGGLASRLGEVGNLVATALASITLVGVAGGEDGRRRRPPAAAGP